MENKERVASCPVLNDQIERTELKTLTVLVFLNSYSFITYCL